MRLYLIRHADPDYENDTITPQGHREAEALGKRLQKESITVLHSSPMGRAQDTAAYVSRATGLPITVQEWTAELQLPNPDPSSPVGAHWDINGETVRGQERLPSSEDWRSFPYFDAETLHTVYDQLVHDSDAFLGNLGYVRSGNRYKIVTSHRDRVAIVAHGGFGLTWLSHLLAIPLPLMWTGFFLPTTSVTTVLFDERSDQWAVPRCLGVGDIGHLYAQRLPPPVAGIKANTD